MRLTGDTGYYRHRDACQDFAEARPVGARSPGRARGHAYPMHVYENIVETLLDHAAIQARTLIKVASELAATPPTHRAGVKHLERERERAWTRYRRDRDAEALETTMRELDIRERAQEAAPGEEPVPAEVAIEYLGALPETWRRAKGGRGRQLLASALFERIAVLGVREATVELSDHAVRHGLAAALPTELWLSVSGRGESVRVHDIGDT